MAQSKQTARRTFEREMAEAVCAARDGVIHGGDGSRLAGDDDRS